MFEARSLFDGVITHQDWCKFRVLSGDEKLLAIFGMYWMIPASLFAIELFELDERRDQLPVMNLPDI